MKHYNLTIWYYIGAIFPFLSVVSCWICFYTLGHFHSDHILTISETVIPFPENRIFPVAMFIESIMLTFFYFIRNASISSFAEEKKIEMPIKKFVMKCTTFCVPLGLIVLSVVTLEDYESIHLIGAFFFFFGSLIYYLVSDFALKQVGKKISIGSQIVSWSILCSMLLYFGFLMFNHIWSLTLGALFQYLTALLIFSKVILLNYDLPHHYLQIKCN